jgi:Protein of unknown function (DUF3617)
MSKPLIISLIALVAPFAVAADTPDTVTPGQWEMSMTFTSVTVGDQAMPVDTLNSRENSRNFCITPEEAKTPQQAFVKRSNTKKCKVNAAPPVPGILAYTLDCEDDEAAGSLAFNGTYTAASYQADMVADVAMSGTKVHMIGVMKGRHLGPKCAAE